MRICNKCGINKEYSFFFKSKKGKDGFESVCK